MVDKRRWDMDERFVGVADAQVATPDVERLLAMTREPGWITEDAAAHLGPACQAAAAAMRLDVRRMEVVDDVLHVDVTAPDGHDLRARRIEGFRLIGAIAESSTHVRERQTESGDLELDVVTGVLPGDTDFATHGHLVRIRVIRQR